MNDNSFIVWAKDRRHRLMEGARYLKRLRLEERIVKHYVSEAREYSRAVIEYKKLHK